MSLSATERSRRHRAHRSGDHGSCDPGRCSEAPGAQPPDLDALAGVSESVAGLLAEVDLGSLSPLHRRLVVEGARIVERLDRMDDLLRGGADEWARLMPDGLDDTHVVVRVDGVLAEARQQALALKSIVAEVRAAAGASSGSPESSAAQQLAGIRDQLAEMRARAVG